MAYKVFLDTNIIVDFLQPVRPFYRDAHDLFMHLYQNNFTAFFLKASLQQQSISFKKIIL